MKGIISALIGGAFFAVPYLALGVELAPAIVIGVAAFGAGNLVLSNPKEIVVSGTEKSLYEVLNDAKKANSQITLIKNKIEDSEVKQDVKDIIDVIEKIIDTISKKPEKVKQVNSFLNYYLPVSLKIIEKYSEIERQKLETEDGKRFMKSSKDMISKIEIAFKEQLSHLYQSDMIDTDAEMKVFETMMKTEGYTDISDFNIK